MNVLWASLLGIMWISSATAAVLLEAAPVMVAPTFTNIAFIIAAGLSNKI